MGESYGTESKHLQDHVRLRFRHPDKRRWNQETEQTQSKIRESRLSHTKLSPSKLSSAFRSSTQPRGCRTRPPTAFARRSTRSALCEARASSSARSEFDCPSPHFRHIAQCASRMQSLSGSDCQHAITTAQFLSFWLFSSSCSIKTQNSSYTCLLDFFPYGNE